VVVRLSVEYVIPVPESWDAEKIWNRRNGHSCAASNAIEEMQEVMWRHGRMQTRLEYVREATADDEECAAAKTCAELAAERAIPPSPRRRRR